MRRLPRAVLSGVLLGIAVAWIVAIDPAQAASSPTKDRYALGDSVMLGAKGDLKDLGFAVVDAAESRQALWSRLRAHIRTPWRYAASSGR